MSLGLVAYDSSDDSGNSEGEEENEISHNQVIAPPQNKQSVKDSTSVSQDPPTPVREPETEDISQPQISESDPHISDDDDDFFSSSRPSSSTSGLHLPAPKHQNVSNSSDQNVNEHKEGGSTLLSGLPIPKSEVKATVVASGEDELEDMVRAKPAEIANREKPPPSKKKVIKITAPRLSAYDSDEDDEPASKKPKPSKGGSKLFSLLPEPKNKSVKEVGRSLIPHTLTKRNPTPAAKQPMHKQPAKSSATKSLPGIPDDDSDNEMDGANFFSIGSEPKSTDNKLLSSASSFTASSSLSTLPAVTRNPATKQNMPLSFGKDTDARLPQATQVGPQPVTAPYGAGPSTYPSYPSASQEYNLANRDEEEYFKEQAALAAAQADADAPLVPDDELKRLQGKRLFRKEEINIIDINAEDAIDRTELLKNLTEETSAHAHSRQFKANAPNTTSKRKHQITYLAHQAKQMELDLKNQWANNRMTKRQTQAKYGF